MVGLVCWLMVFNSTVNNISVISWRSVLLVEETGVHRENHRPAPSHSPHGTCITYTKKNVKHPLIY